MGNSSKLKKKAVNSGLYVINRNERYSNIATKQKDAREMIRNVVRFLHHSWSGTILLEGKLW